MNELDTVEEEMRERLGPQVDKLRFVRELTRNVDLGDELSIAGENNESVARGLHEFLFELTGAYDEVYGVIKNLMGQQYEADHQIKSPGPGQPMENERASRYRKEYLGLTNYLGELKGDLITLNWALIGLCEGPHQAEEKDYVEFYGTFSLLCNRLVEKCDEIDKQTESISNGVI